MTTHDKHPDYASIQSRKLAFTSLDVEDPMQPHAKPMSKITTSKSLSGSSSSSDPFDLMQSQCGPLTTKNCGGKRHMLLDFSGVTTFIAELHATFSIMEAGGLIAASSILSVWIPICGRFYTSYILVSLGCGQISAALPLVITLCSRIHWIHSQSTLLLPG